ncbi:hypothetical protein F0562_027659 [Nyssa sinensis]|uniref:Remorin C-terminal domain-containing protein n=1 Tax=Nyssa sinensis TaxID=561372 RepID=A0A5J5B981_9ASTE|nr:hypothetical protein F0562_027659 [Nyssa sinensis]
MPELGFQDQNLLRLGYRARDVSPDSVIFTVESNFSLFSSASASVDRCSFASDVHDHESLVSEISQHLAGHDLPETSSGPDPDPNRSTIHKNSGLSKKVEKSKVRKEDNVVETEDENQTLDSARSSFSQALKECQDRRSRYEAILTKPDRRRPASLDLNNSITNAINSSPRFGIMKKNSVLTRRTGTFPSPGTPNYQHASVALQKGWSSERVPLHANANRRHVGPALLPFNSGRTLPSKWEDAERWIFSPVAVDGLLRPSFPQPHRRPKSKSGPLGPPGIAYHSLFSPAMPLFGGGNVGNLMSGFPGLAWRGRLVYMGALHCRANHLCPDSQDEKLDGVKDAATNISRAVSRRDMATQMSPDVDEQVTVTRWSKKHKARFPGKGSENIDDGKKKAVEAQSSAWEVSETAKSISKVKREEAKITAWENLQKAKAEAEIQKLEMKLEKKRSSSMDKIMKKLRSAQRKAQEMRMPLPAVCCSILTSISRHV